MGTVVERTLPQLAARARAEVSSDVFERAADGTLWAQPAIYCAALAGWERLRWDVCASAMAGHSLGEITALAAAGVISYEDGLRLVAARGRLMAAAGASSIGGMLAVRVRDRETLAAVAAACRLTIANDNAHDQVVLSGGAGALEAAGGYLRLRGIAATRLPVSAAFHSPLMQPAVAPFREVLASVEVREPRVPVWSCVTGEPFTDVRGQLVESLTSPVRWRDVLRSLRDAGVKDMVETGPGRVLTKLVRANEESAQPVAELTGV